MKYLVIFVLIFGSIIEFGAAQVVIEDIQFQISDTCPVAEDDFEVLTHWKQITGNPDYFDCDYTFQIDFAVSDYDPNQQNYVGMKVLDDSLQSADSFGQNLNEPILPGEFVTMTIVGQTVYGGQYSGNCAGISVYGLNDTIEANMPYNNIGEVPNIQLLTSTDVYTFWDWDIRGVSFTATDTVKALIFSPELVAGCKQYLFLDRIVFSNQVGVEEQQLSDIEIYPNPASSVLHIENAFDLNAHYQVVSTAGVVIQNGQLTDSIDVSKLATGFYLLKISVNDEIVGEKPFMKE